MNPKKIFIISMNQLSADFWKEHIDFKKSKVWYWNTPENGINNITTVWPDAIILDTYWAESLHHNYLSKILKLKHNIKVFCFTPVPKSLSKTVIIDERLHVSRLDQESLDMINEIINLENKIEYKKSA